MSWSHHGTPVWYIDPSLYHYRCIHCYMPTTGIVCISDTLQYTPKAFAFPNTTTEEYPQQAILDTILIIQVPLEENYFLTLRRCNRCFDQADCSYFSEKNSSASLANFTIASNVTADLESRSITANHQPSTCTSSEGGTCCGTSKGENTHAITHTTSEGESLTTS